MAAGIRLVSKLIILPCSEPKEGKLIPKGVPFIAPYNPTTFSFSSLSEFAIKNTSKKTSGRVELLHNENKTLSVELFLDGTGASPPLGIPTASAFGTVASALASASGSSVSAINAEAGVRAVTSSVAVTAWINYFFAITANGKSPIADAKKTLKLNMATVNDETHTSNPLKLMWGAGLFFNCRLMDATVNFKLFNQLGLPLRATISATFIEISKTETNKLASPDLTKVHIVKAGDTIYNLAKQEYEDESYYLQIAEANDLKNYRRLVPGQTLILPPIAKVEE